MRRGTLLAAALVAVIAACQEDLTTPAQCPELCPGTSLLIRDTVIEALPGLDSSYTGYIGANDVPALLVSDGLAAGEARAWATFPRRADSVLVGGTQQALTTDSVAISFLVLGLDKSAGSPRLYVHRISPFTDTTTTVEQIDAQLVPESLIDSIQVSDTGTARLVLKGDDLAKLNVEESDSFRIGLGIRVRGPGPTGVRLASLLTSSRPPTITTYGRVAVTDTALQRQTLGLTADAANYAINAPAPPGLDVIFIGGKRASRAILRFPRPGILRDSATILRATLELTPSIPLLGLPNDLASLQVRGVLADVGAKSPYIANFGASGIIPVEVSSVVSVDAREIVATWFGPDPPPSALFVGLTPEGGTFALPEFFSTRSGTGAPRLRITYALPSRPGHP
ncbi:MAG TPA: hypothetical protein VF187_04340 [Gemmatimonadales bacterium]